MFARRTKFAALIVAGLMMSVQAHAGLIGGDNTYNQGGTGVGVGVGVGIGGSAVQGQQQGQQQGQVAIGQGGKGGAGGAGGAASAANSATVIGGNNSNTNGASLSGSMNVGSTTIEGDTFEASKAGAQTAYAPNIYPTAPCMGSTSAGGQGSMFGFSFGTSWKDTDCSLREDVRTVAQVIGDQQTAAEMFCQKNDAYRAAREAQGKPCGVKVAARAAGAGVVNVASNDRAAAAAVARGEQIDPLTRSRLGLPPLN
jgi:hypothetical protein